MSIQRTSLTGVHILIILIFLTGCSGPSLFQAEFVLGTVCTITLYEAGRPRVYREIFQRLGEIDRRMSVLIAENDVDRINKAAGKEAVKVQDDVFEVIERALYYTDLCGGAFDITIGPLVSLWDIEGRSNIIDEFIDIPSQHEINDVLPLINWKNIELDKENKTVFLKNQGMAINLGAIAKGYAADEAAKIIKAKGIPRGIIDLGGNILFVGNRQDSSPWRVGIQDPLDNRGAYVGIVQVYEETVVSSGVYERYFFSDGIQYHHILDPLIGYPVQNGLLSVTIIGTISLDADALSTAVFVLGYEQGKALIDSLEGVEAVFIFEDLNIRKTSGANFILTNNNYKLDFETF